MGSSTTTSGVDSLETLWGNGSHSHSHNMLICHVGAASNIADLQLDIDMEKDVTAREREVLASPERYGTPIKSSPSQQQQQQLQLQFAGTDASAAALLLQSASAPALVGAAGVGGAGLGGGIAGG